MTEDHYATVRIEYDRTDWVCHNVDAEKPEILQNVPYHCEQHRNWAYCPICGAEL